jgi:hypothetical protein
VRTKSATVSRAGSLVRALRRSPLARSALVFLPALVSGRLFETRVFLTVLGAAVGVALMAASMRLLEDARGADASRRRMRPAAPGGALMLGAAVLCLMLAGAALLTGWMVGRVSLAGWLIAYAALDAACGLLRRAGPVGEAIMFAIRCTLAIWVGGMVVGATLGFWLMFAAAVVGLALAGLLASVGLALIFLLPLHGFG